jgi:hypothetical protein
MKTFAVMTDSYGTIELADICTSIPIAKSVVKALKRSHGKGWYGKIWIEERRVTDTEYTGGKWWSILLTLDGEPLRALCISFREATEADTIDPDNGDFRTVVKTQTKAKAIKIAQQRQKDYPEELK